MNKNDDITLQITDLGVHGEGIGHSGGKAVFVPGALPGETVAAHVISAKKNYAVAKLSDILIASPARVKPKCLYFGKCGGCTLQHLSYAEQLEWKRRRVGDCLSRIGGIDIDVPFPLPSAREYHYRNKASFPCGDQNGYKAVGLYKQHSHVIIDIDDCRIQHDEVKVVMSQLRVWMAKYDVPPYDETTGQGLLRHVVVRSDRDGEVMLTLVINGDEIPGQKHLLALFKLALPKVKSIVLNINKKPGNVIMGDTNIPIFGAGFFYETLCGMKFKVSAGAFLQVNHGAAEALYNDVFKKLALTSDETVLDLYCGVGTLTLMAAKRAKAAYGVEISESAVKDARFNAGLNDIENAFFYSGDAETAFDQALHDAGKIDAVIVDPPRKGLTSGLIRKIAQVSPAKIAYASCDPATLARDLKLFGELGYKTNAVQPVDLFPQTSHIETVALLSPKSG